MLGALEIIVILIVVGGLLLLQIKTRTGPLIPYMAVVILLLLLILAMGMIRSLSGVIMVLALVCAVLLYRVVRSRQTFTRRVANSRLRDHLDQM